MTESEKKALFEKEFAALKAHMEKSGPMGPEELRDAVLGILVTLAAAAQAYRALHTRIEMLEATHLQILQEMLNGPDTSVVH